MEADQSLPQDQVLATVRARTVLDVSHQVWCEQVDGRPVVPAAVGLLTVGGRPHLVPDGRAPWPGVGAALTCVAMLDDLGTVRLTGRVGVARTGAQDPELGRVLRQHRGCLISHVPVDALAVFPLEVTTVALLVPGQASPHPLDPAAVRAARADWLLLHAPQVVAHLETDHGTELVLLAASRGVPGASAVSLRRLTRDGVQLVCLTGPGVTTVDLVFDPPVDEPAQLWNRLTVAPAR